MANLDAERAYVGGLYSGKKWKNQVKHMSDEQVLAIHLRERRKEKAAKVEAQAEIAEATPKERVPFWKQH